MFLDCDKWVLMTLGKGFGGARRGQSLAAKDKAHKVRGRRGADGFSNSGQCRLHDMIAEDGMNM